jgi:YesN/AraC family two-component response regulator
MKVLLNTPKFNYTTSISTSSTTSKNYYQVSRHHYSTDYNNHSNVLFVASKLKSAKQIEMQYKPKIYLDENDYVHFIKFTKKIGYVVKDDISIKQLPECTYLDFDQIAKQAHGCLVHGGFSKVMVTLNSPETKTEVSLKLSDNPACVIEVSSTSESVYNCMPVFDRIKQYIEEGFQEAFGKLAVKMQYLDNQETMDDLTTNVDLKQDVDHLEPMGLHEE